MKTGQTFVFRYAPGGRHYRVHCELTPEMAIQQDTAAFASIGDTSQDQAVAQDLTSRYAQSGMLSDQLHFDRGDTVVDTRAEAATDTGTAADDGTDDSDLSWTDAIFFYSDGTTSTATVRLESNRFGRMIELSLRGLTGVATVGQIEDATPDVSMGNQQ